MEIPIILRADHVFLPIRIFDDPPHRGENRRALLPEAALALLIAADGAEEVDLAEGGPVGVAKGLLAVGALPEQEAAQADLAAGTEMRSGSGRS